MKIKYLREIKKAMETIESAKNNFQVAICLDKIKTIITEAEGFNRPDIVVCDSCMCKGGDLICKECDDGDKFEKE